MCSTLRPESGAKRAAPDPKPKNFRSGYLSKIVFKKDLLVKGRILASESKEPATISNLIFKKLV